MLAAGALAVAGGALTADSSGIAIGAEAALAGLGGLVADAVDETAAADDRCAG
jgi:hypothetical protein